MKQIAFVCLGASLFYVSLDNSLKKGEMRGRYVFLRKHRTLVVHARKKIYLTKQIALFERIISLRLCLC